MIRCRSVCAGHDGWSANEGISYNVRVYKSKVYKGKTVTTYYVRWKVGDREWKEPFRVAAQADSFRSSLLTAARSGEAFSLATGQPIAWQRADNDMSWYDFACSYSDMEWKSASAKYRKDIARALTAATPAMFNATRGEPDDARIRQALLRWGFNTKQRASVPAEVADVLRWVRLFRSEPLGRQDQIVAVAGLVDSLVFLAQVVVPVVVEVSVGADGS